MVEVNLVPFKHKHLALIHEMLKDQESQYMRICDIQTSTLPKIGYIAMVGDQPIACGFLRRLEPNFAQIDTLVSNPYFGSQIRHEGIRLVVDTLVNDAKRLKLKGILALTRDNGTLMRAMALGFVVLEQAPIALSLENSTNG